MKQKLHLMELEVATVGLDQVVDREEPEELLVLLVCLELVELA